MFLPICKVNKEYEIVNVNFFYNRQFLGAEKFHIPKLP